MNLFEIACKEKGYVDGEAWQIVFKKGEGFVPRRVPISRIVLYPSGIAAVEVVEADRVYKTKEEAEEHCARTHWIDAGGILLTWEE